jgi:hypothetical protein
MVSEAQARIRDLPRGHCIALPAAGASRIACLQGAIWLTQEESNVDVVLEAGQAWEPRPGATVYAQAVGAAARMDVGSCEPELTRTPKEAFMKARFFAAFAAVVFALIGLNVLAQHHGHLMLTADQLKWGDVPSLPPGARLAVIEGPLNQPGPFTIRIRMPADYAIAPHWHPAIEHVTVMSGTFHMGTGEVFDRSKGTAITPGGVAIMQPKTTHYAWTREETEIQVHGVGPWAINYVNPADDPRKK